MGQPQSGPRRVLRDLVPATLATGAAGLVVTLLVGGTTQGIGSVLVDGADRSIPEYTVGAEASASLRPDAVTVHVRPGLPRPIGVVSVLDLLPFSPTAEPGRAVEGVVLARTGPTVAAAARADTVVVTDALTDVATAPAATVVVPAPASVAVIPAPDVVAASEAATPRRRPARTAKPAKTVPALTVASAERVELSSDNVAATSVSSATSATTEAERGDDRPHEAPPDHAPAHGRRVR